MTIGERPEKYLKKLYSLYSQGLLADYLKAALTPEQLNNLILALGGALPLKNENLVTQNNETKPTDDLSAKFKHAQEAAANQKKEKELACRRETLEKRLAPDDLKTRSPLMQDYAQEWETRACRKENVMLLEQLQKVYLTIVEPEAALFGEVIALLVLCTAYCPDRGLSATDIENALDSVATRYKNHLAHNNGILAVPGDPFQKPTDKIPVDEKEEFRKRARGVRIELAELNKLKRPITSNDLEPLEEKVAQMEQAIENLKQQNQSPEAQRLEAGFRQQYPLYRDRRAKLAYVGLLCALQEELEAISAKDNGWSETELAELAEKLRRKMDGFMFLEYQFSMQPWTEETGFWYDRDHYDQDALFLNRQDGSPVCVVRGKVTQTSDDEGF